MTMAQTITYSQVRNMPHGSTNSETPERTCHMEDGGIGKSAFILTFPRGNRQGRLQYVLSRVRGNRQRRQHYVLSLNKPVSSESMTMGRVCFRTQNNSLFTSEEHATRKHKLRNSRAYLSHGKRRNWQVRLHSNFSTGKSTRAPAIRAFTRTGQSAKATTLCPFTQQARLQHDYGVRVLLHAKQ